LLVGAVGLVVLKEIPLGNTDGRVSQQAYQAMVSL